MRPLLLLLFVSTLLGACRSRGAEQLPPSVAQASALLTESDVRIHPSVDTTAAAEREAIACLRRFFAKKLVHDAGNDYWYAPDLERYGAPYSELFYAEYDSVGDLRYLPTVLSLRPAEEGRFLTVMWAADGVGADEARYMFEFLVRTTDEGARLSFPLAHNTEAWERRSFGALTYVISPRHVFDQAEADAQRTVIEQLALWFDVPVFPITFYSFADPADLYRAKGFLRHPLMHTITTGGMVDEGNNVYSGNNKDIYTHEVVHLFSHRKFPDRSDLLDEGLATWIGGSTERDYAWHRANMGNYLLSDTTIDLRDRCNTYQRDEIAGLTSVPYMVGALLCERIVRAEGKEGLFRAFASGSDTWSVLAGHGIVPNNLTDEIRKELRKDPLRAL